MEAIKLYRRPLQMGTAVLVFLTIISLTQYVYAFTPNERYTVSVEAVQSDGTLTSGSTTLGISTSATADSEGKLTFTLSGVPDSSSYNFLVITTTDSTGTIARRSIVPAPASAGSLNLGVSPVTDAQAESFIAAFAAAGTDDPIMAIFGYTIVRSGALSAQDLSTMATFCYQGIKGTDGTGTTNGYEAFLRSSDRANPATDAMMANFRSNIVAKLRDYSALYKESVDEYFNSGASAEVDKRGEAAANLLKYLVEAGSDAGIDEDDLMMAFNDMGAIVVPLMIAAVNEGTLSEEAHYSIESTIGRGIDKLRADKFLQTYTDALTLMGATSGEISRYTTAANTLMNTMIETFKDFEQSVNGDDLPDPTEIQDAGSSMETAMDTAFNTFMSSIAATDDEITSLRSLLAGALGNIDADTYLPVDRFKFYNMSGEQVNWPIMMVVSVRWLANVLSNGGSVEYTRDTLSVPTNMVWLTFQGGRTDFTALFPEGPCQSWAGLEGLREDIEIIEFSRFANFSEFDPNDQAQMMLDMRDSEITFYGRLDALKDNIAGTTDGSTSIPDAQKEALITLFLSPQF